MEDRTGAVQQKVLGLFLTAGEKRPDAESLEITVNFHPDRMTADGRLIISELARDGILRSQFETRTSNGGLAAFVGGDRWNWESAAFNCLYDDAAASDRPKYGALNHRRNGAGGSPRFGSCYFVLKSDCLNRTTFCYPESWLGPREYGYADRVANLIRLADSDDLDFLDSYIEAHIHGRLEIASDMEKLVLDPCFRNTAIESAAEKLDCNVEWHKGFKLQVHKLDNTPLSRHAVHCTRSRTCR